MKANIKGKILAVFLCVSILLACTITAFSATEYNGSVTVSFAVENTEFQIFKIGNVENNELVLSDEYAKYRVDMESKSAADTLTLYLKKDKVAPLKTAVTNASKKAVFDNLDKGVYLVTGENFVKDKYYYNIKSFIVYMPYNDGNGDDWNVNAEAKYEVTDYEDGDVCSLNAIKIWRSRTRSKSYPEVKMLLLRDYEVYDSIILSEENNWTHQWNNLDANYFWCIVEEGVDPNFVVTIDVEDDLHTVTNTEIPNNPTEPTATEPSTAPTTADSSTTPTDSTEPSSNSTSSTVPNTGDSQPTEPTQPSTVPNEKLTQTGQLNWPVPVLCFCGAVFMIIGVAVMRKKQ